MDCAKCGLPLDMKGPPLGDTLMVLGVGYHVGCLPADVVVCSVVGCNATATLPASATAFNYAKGWKLTAPIKCSECIERGL